MRTDPYVALPFGSDRERAELVGSLLHPVSRSETWRRLVTPPTVSARSISKRAVQSPWRRANRRTASFGGRAPIAQGGPIWRKPTAKTTTQLQQQRNYCTRFEQNPKGKNLSVALLSRLFTVGYGVRDGAERQADPRSGHSSVGRERIQIDYVSMS